MRLRELMSGALASLLALGHAAAIVAPADDTIAEPARELRWATGNAAHQARQHHGRVLGGGVLDARRKVLVGGVHLGGAEHHLGAGEDPGSFLGAGGGAHASPRRPAQSRANW